ncbi:MAG: DUF4143 domain-containing protein [Actinomycetaceae bacterium]|nr:DUF4143 domain-containing protein [Actinomycetaceae bacterium]
MNTDYVPRLLDKQLASDLSTSPAVILEGPRACGKTETASQVAASHIFLDDTSAASNLARTQPIAALPGDTPRLLDEWTAIPGLWNEIRHEVDKRRSPGQFILTGSANPPAIASRHSGAGRFQHLHLSTMTLLERGLSTGAASLGDLAKGRLAPSIGVDVAVTDYTHWIVQGGWPGFLQLDSLAASRRVAGYVQDLVQHDFPEVAGMRRDPRRFEAFLRAYAGLVASPATFAAIARRLGEDFHLSTTAETVQLFHDFATRLFVIEDQPPFSPRLRSASSPIQTPKRHFADPSLAAALLQASPTRLLADLETLGLLFESLVVHDLRVYAQVAFNGKVTHFRDRKARDEIDIVLETPEGDWIGIEVKLSHLFVDAAAENLLRVAAKIDPAPAALAVVIPSGPIIQRNDGVWVIPLAACGP